MVLSGYVDLHVKCIIPPYISSQNGYLNFYRIRFSNYLPHSISDMQMNVPWGACMRVFQNCCLNFEETTHNTINNKRQVRVRTVQVNCFLLTINVSVLCFYFHENITSRSCLSVPHVFFLRLCLLLFLLQHFLTGR